MIASYADLKSRLLSWLWNRGDIVDELPAFIQLAEAEMNRRLTSRLKVTTDLVAIDDELIDLPQDFAGVVSFKLTDFPYTELKFRTPDGITKASDGLASTDSYALSGAPLAYAIVGELFQFFPVPDREYEAVLTWRARIPPLSDASPTNWVLANHPDAYLYGALVHAAMWLRNPDLAQTSATAFASVLADIQAADVVETQAPNLEMTPNAPVIA